METARQLKYSYRDGTDLGLICGKQKNKKVTQSTKECVFINANMAMA
jgi:hypothetical protein